MIDAAPINPAMMARAQQSLAASLDREADERAAQGLFDFQWFRLRALACRCRGEVLTVEAVTAELAARGIAP